MYISLQKSALGCSQAWDVLDHRTAGFRALSDIRAIGYIPLAEHAECYTIYAWCLCSHNRKASMNASSDKLYLVYC